MGKKNKRNKSIFESTGICTRVAVRAHRAPVQTTVEFGAAGGLVGFGGNRGLNALGVSTGLGDLEATLGGAAGGLVTLAAMTAMSDEVKVKKILAEDLDLSSTPASKQVDVQVQIDVDDLSRRIAKASVDARSERERLDKIALVAVTWSRQGATKAVQKAVELGLDPEADEADIMAAVKEAMANDLAAAKKKAAAKAAAA